MKMGCPTTRRFGEKWDFRWSKMERNRRVRCASGASAPTSQWARRQRGRNLFSWRVHVRAGRRGNPAQRQRPGKQPRGRSRPRRRAIQFQRDKNRQRTWTSRAGARLGVIDSSRRPEKLSTRKRLGLLFRRSRRAFLHAFLHTLLHVSLTLGLKLLQLCLLIRCE